MPHKNESLRLKLVESLRSLQDKSTPEGQLKVLVNSLYSLPTSVVEELLLQVVHVSVSHLHPETHRILKRYLVHLASKSLYLAIRLSWNVDALLTIFQQLGAPERIADLRDQIETVAIRRREQHLSSSPNRPATTSQPASPLSPRTTTMEPSTSEMQTAVNLMQRRLALFNDTRHFMAQLTNISGQLRLIPDKSKRKEELHRQLEAINQLLVAKRIIYPMATSDENVVWIARVAISECTVFSSRERAPYSLVCEVICDGSATFGDPTSTSLFGADGSEALPVPTTQTTMASPSSSRHHHRSLTTGKDDDLLTTVFGETSAQRKARLRATSPLGAHPDWDVKALIVKAGDDLRQEELALQIIYVFNNIFKEAGLTCCVMPYAAVSTTFDAGVIECLTDASSIDGIKKAAGVTSLHQFFVNAYGGETSSAYALAQRNFIESMAGYSVVMYLMQIKDRHNGNLMLTRSGHLVHIDFGFMLATSPGGIKFESAPFKLSQELVDVMGGVNSPTFAYFKILLFQGFWAAREHAEEIIALVELMTPFNTIACFGPDPASQVSLLEQRLRLNLESEVEFAVYVKELVSISVDNWRTRKYDQFQTLQNGII